MKMATHAQVFVPGPPEEVFDAAVDLTRFPTVLAKYGPIPGIVSVAVLDGAEHATGVVRRVTLTDGGVVDEEVLALERPRRHRYRWVTLPKPPFSWLIRGAEADWTFSADGGGTTIRWDYSFELTSILVAPLAAVVIRVFRGWMAQGLKTIAKLRADA